MSGPSPTAQPSDAVREPPEGILGALRYMGPGLILSAAIVGSGELIATTTLGAKAGFALLWVVLLGCVVKVAVQVEYGRFCILHGRTTFQAWNGSRSGKLRGVHWTIYLGAIYMLANMAGQAGVLGGASQVAHYAFPRWPLPLWVGINALVIIALIAHGRYEPIEWVATALNAIFVGAVLYCCGALQLSAHRFSFGDLASGLSLHLPKEYMGLALAAFGITGVAAGEITMYPYWCLEKGYARWTGPNDGSEAWARRARGWLRVMIIDALAAMTVYTVATCGFYILGAAVLRNQPALKDGNEFILQLSAMFTDVLGPRARGVFMLCAFAVLFSTVFANAASFSRLWVDFFGLSGWLNWHDAARRSLWIALVAGIYAVACAIIYLLVQRPLFLVKFMGICNALFLVVVAWHTLRFRYHDGDPRLRPGPIYDAALWTSLFAIAFMAGRSLYGLFPT